MCRLGSHVADDFTHSISVQQLPFQISDTLCCVPYCVCFYTLLYTKKHKHTTLKSLQAVVIVLLCEKYKKFAKHEHVSSHLVKNTQLVFFTSMQFMMMLFIRLVYTVGTYICTYRVLLYHYHLRKQKLCCLFSHVMHY